LRTTTPTGHGYDSTAPPPLPSLQKIPVSAEQWSIDESVLERELEQLICDHRSVLCDSGIGHAPQ
jgi:hypothetical protein